MFCVVKGRLLHCKRASFTLQKGVFYTAKGHLLECKRRPFKNQITIYFTIIEIYLLPNLRMLHTPNIHLRGTNASLKNLHKYHTGGD